MSFDSKIAYISANIKLPCEYGPLILMLRPMVYSDQLSTSKLEPDDASIDYPESNSGMKEKASSSSESDW